jgi:hypothetical protein
MSRTLLPVAVGLFALGLLMTRLPVVLLTNFWAEDGTTFYAQAYNVSGLQALLIPWTGYLQTLPRLEAAVAIHFPLTLGPYLATAVALVFDVLPGAFFVSDRFREVVPSRAVRVIVGVISVIMPDSFELMGNLANVQWHLGLLAFLIIVAPEPPRTRLGDLLDFAALAVSSISGPFCFLLGPIAVWRWIWRRESWFLPRLAVIIAAMMVQGIVVLTHFGDRQGMLLGPSLHWLVRALDRPLVTPLIGGVNYQQLLHSGLWAGRLPALVLLLATLLIGYAAWRGPHALRLFFVFAAGVMVMTLVSPVAANTPEGQWAGLTGWYGQGDMRYYYIPSLAWVLALLCAALRAHWRVLRILAALVLISGLVVAVPRDWRYPDLAPTGFQAAAERFDRAPRGTTMTIPIEIPGWTMTLHKR